MHDGQNGKPPPKDAIPMLRRDWEGIVSREDREDLRLISRAIREGWPVPRRLRKRVCRALAMLLAGDDRRLWVAAARAAIAADTVTVRKAEAALRNPTASAPPEEPVAEVVIESQGQAQGLHPVSARAAQIRRI